MKKIIRIALITIKKIEFIILILSKKKSPDTLSLENSTKHLKNKHNLFTILHNLFQKIKEETLPNSFMKLILP